MKTPLFTEQTECRDCYKCVRWCPVKAISVKDHHAVVETDRCILCGRCVKVCPAGAQRVRNDIPRVKQLITIKKKVYLSLAPSFPAEFEGSWRELLPKLKALGFAGVSETAHGADLVSQEQQKMITKDSGLTLSTACPTLVEIIERYYPELKPNLSLLSSPMVAHATQLRKLYGEDIGVVFAGPCVAKKLEADRVPDLVDVALTFNELAKLVDNVTIENEERPLLVPSRPKGGVVYPLDGGMIETMRKSETSSILETGFANIAGIEQLLTTLDELKESKDDDSLFCEMLACDGGCINGSGSVSKDSLLTRRTRMATFCREEEHLIPAEDGNFPLLDATEIFRGDSLIEPVSMASYSADEIKEAFEQLEKKGSDLLDCGGCGYNSCSSFAGAWLSGFAEREMCVTSMRKRAQNKVNALIKTIPMGVVIVNRDNRMLDCNDRFVRLFVGDDFVTDIGTERFRNMDLEKFVPVSTLVREVQTTLAPVEKILNHDGRVLQVVLFPIENSGTTGLLFQDITEPSMKRDTVIRKAEEVIHKNLQSVQQIASLLGENAAETEIILNSLIDAFDTGARK